MISWVLLNVLYEYSNNIICVFVCVCGGGGGGGGGGEGVIVCNSRGSVCI
jgi:hypothetical protein